MQNRTHTHFTLPTSFQGIMCEKVHLQELTLARFASRSSCRLTSLGLRLASCHFVHGDGACSPPSPSSPSCSRATSGSWSGCTGRFDNTGRQSRRQAPKAKFQKVFDKVVNLHLLVLLLRLDHLDLRVLLLQACSRSFPRRARLMRGACGVAEA